MSSPNITISPTFSPTITIGGAVSSTNVRAGGGGGFAGGGLEGFSSNLRGVSGALAGVRGNFLGVFFASLFQQMAVDRVTDSWVRYKAAVDRFGADSPQAIRALNDLTQAQRLMQLQNVQISVQFLLMAADVTLYTVRLIHATRAAYAMAQAQATLRATAGVFAGAGGLGALVGIGATIGLMALFTTLTASSRQPMPAATDITIGNINLQTEGGFNPEQALNYLRSQARTAP